MTRKLYVGNLSANVTEEDLKHNFSGIGGVLSAIIIKDKFTNISKGFAFVEMDSEEGAREAIKRFNGGELDGTSITVNEARPKKDDGGYQRRDSSRSGGYRGGSSRGGGRY